MIVKHRGRVYSISSGEMDSTVGVKEFAVAKAKQLPNKKLLIEDLRTVMAHNENEVAGMIRKDEYNSFKELT
jgi:hypothetical protein